MLARRDALVSDHLSLVESIARTVHRRLPPSFDLDDLIGVGHQALIQAATRYRPAQHDGTPFSAYARLWIRGAIIDSARSRRYRDATCEPLPASDLERLTITPDRESSIDSSRLHRRVTAAIELLPDRQRRVLALYYGDDLPTFPAVGAALGVSGARASQLHAAAIARLRKLLRTA